MSKFLLVSSLLFILSACQLDSNRPVDPFSTIVGTVQGPYEGLTASALGVIYNDQDADSQAIATYYQQKRNVPETNMIAVSFTPGSKVMAEATFASMRETILNKSHSGIQAYVYTWMKPYRAECMSMTSAISLGFDRDKYCATPCERTEPVAYFSSETVAPYTDLGIRPTMALAGTSVDNVKAVIDRGLLAEKSFPRERGYALRTTDSARSVRWPDMMQLPNLWNIASSIGAEYINNSGGGGSNVIKDKDNVLFYFTGLSQVPDLATNGFLPGSVGDHLTSFGGVLDTTGQMSCLRWLEAGTSGSYGTVVEPCNYTDKFPKVSTLLDFYYRGATLIEAYWKSVRTPGEGIFVGDPLTRPWGTTSVLDLKANRISIRTTGLKPGRRYNLQQANKLEGPYQTVKSNIMISKYEDYTLDYELTVNGNFFKLVESR